MDIKVKEAYVREAMELHKQFPVTDAHLDLAGEVLLRKKAGEKDIVKNHYLEHFKAAGMNLIVSSVYVENANLDHAWENALEQISALKEDVATLRQVRLILNKTDLEQAKREGKIGILLYMEGLECIGEDTEKIEELYKLGVRGASLTWSRAGLLAVGCCTAVQHIQIPGKLTETGIRAVKKLEDLSMFLDVSHLNDEGYEQLFSIAQKPFIATHSCSRTVYDNYRNLTDDQMKALAAQGGIMGLNGCKYIAGALEGNDLEMLCRHVEYETETIGAEHVGFGFDLCDSYGRARAKLLGLTEPDKEDCLLHHGQIPLVTAALLQRGMSRQELSLIIGKNFWKYFKNCLPDVQN